MVRTMLLSALLLSATATIASEEFYGLLHNNDRDLRATLETGERLYLLDYGAYSLFRTAEKYDREHVIVRGTRSSTSLGDPVIIVESITFRPRGRSITYNLPRAREVPKYRYVEKTYETKYDDEYPTGYERHFTSEAKYNKFID
jgi:hypothetical protein